MNESEIPNLEKYPHFKNYLDEKKFYILDKDNNVIPANILEWGRFFQDEYYGERIVKRTDIENYKISTVFIGINNNFCMHVKKECNCKPWVFETMIFLDGESIYCDRYSTWKEAEEGHEKAIE